MRGDRRWLTWLLIAAIALGVGFRFYELDRKLVWHDEVYTSIRAAGYTRLEIDKELFQDHFVTATDLQKFQKLKPGSTDQDTIASLIKEDPQHPPLYFLIARSWMEWFGSDRTAIRSLPALISLISLPLIYGLAWELFAAEAAVVMIALMAVALLALSPFDLLFAQTARQYSLLTATVIGSSYVLLRALRWGIWQNWLLYISAVTLGLYAHPFFALTLIGHGVFILPLAFVHREQPLRKLGIWLLSVGAALLFYSPWILVLAVQSKRVLATTDWNRVDVGWLYLAKIWTLSFTSLFFDLDFGFDQIWTYLPRLPYLGLIAIAIYWVCLRTPALTWQFLLTSIFVPFLLLAIPDLILGGKRSAVSRYLISCFPGVQVAIAYLLITWKGRIKPLVLAIVLSGAILSAAVSAAAETWWVKDLSYHNAAAVKVLPPAPVIISDMGNDYTNMGDLISLSYLLPPTSEFYLTKQPPDLTNLQGLSGDRLVLFHPSQLLIQAFRKEFGTVQQIDPLIPSLWQLSK
jgi:uncharacterized membrane protein